MRAAEKPISVSHIAFTGPDGKQMTLGDFKGKTLLVNLWATWCAPCREEMPALDKLEAEKAALISRSSQSTSTLARMTSPKAF